MTALRANHCPKGQPLHDMTALHDTKTWRHGNLTAQMGSGNYISHHLQKHNMTALRANHCPKGQPLYNMTALHK